MIDADMLTACLHIPHERAEHWVDHLNSAMDAFEIDRPLRVGAFLAQCAHESGFFTRWVENLDYRSPQRIRAVFGTRRFPTENSAGIYLRNPQMLANKVYANRLGNGDEASDDGWRYRGRGFLQITGRTNYARCSEGLDLDLLNHPQLLEREDLAVMASAWWWADNGCNTAADSGEIDRVTRIVNGPAMQDRDERERIYLDCMEMLVT
jgi:putative chitinase